jgi:hypothetical protein
LKVEMALAAGRRPHPDRVPAGWRGRFEQVDTMDPYPFFSLFSEPAKSNPTHAND